MAITAHNFYNTFNQLKGIEEKLEHHLLFQNINIDEAVNILSEIQNKNKEKPLTALSFDLANLYIKEHNAVVVSAFCKAVCLFIERLELEYDFADVLQLCKIGAEQNPHFQQLAKENYQNVEDARNQANKFRRYCPKYAIYNSVFIILHTALSDKPAIKDTLFTNFLAMQMPATAEMRESNHNRYKLMEKGNVVSKNECYTLMKEALEEAAKNMNR